MKKKFMAGLAMGLLAVGLAGVANANLVTNGSFEAGVENSGSFKTLGDGDTTSITGWSITGGTVDWINNYWTASDLTRSLDMSGNSQGTISTTFATFIGTKYDVSFDMAGNIDGGPQIKTLQAQVGAQSPQDFIFDTTGRNHTTMGWMKNTFSFTASDTSTTLSFHDLSTNGGYNYYGAALDNVIVNASPVPEPATMMLFGVGVAGLAGLARRKKI